MPSPTSFSISLPTPNDGTFTITLLHPHSSPGDIGWRVAWALGPSELLHPLAQAHTHMTFNAPTPLQAGIAAALDAEDGLPAIPGLFGGNFQMLSEALRTGTPVKEICEAQVWSRRL